MPIISAFFGMVEHAPPHFRAECQGQQATVDFAGNPLAGNLSSGTAQRLIREWAGQHRAHLEANWGSRKLGAVFVDDGDQADCLAYIGRA